MIGVGRTIRDGKTTAYEMIVLREQGDQLAYEAHPSGQAPTTFVSTRISASELVFENPAHDFPQEVGYRRDGNRLFAWIRGAQNGKSGGLNSSTPARRVTIRERLGRFLYKTVAGRVPPPGLQAQHGPPRVDRPAGRLVPALDALQVHAVFFELHVLSCPQNAQMSRVKEAIRSPSGKTQTAPFAVPLVESTPRR